MYTHSTPRLYLDQVNEPVWCIPPCQGATYVRLKLSGRHVSNLLGCFLLLMLGLWGYCRLPYNILGWGPPVRCTFIRLTRLSSKPICEHVLSNIFSTYPSLDHATRTFWPGRQRRRLRRFGGSTSSMVCPESGVGTTRQSMATRTMDVDEVRTQLGVALQSVLRRRADFGPNHKPRGW